ncbi:hypothetical protein PVL29_011081 [Vitis rotundifolia]|uniref:Uncharacterized protein n=1 Tax=Vitis rotundifolia TaxID=103349 RepID=A0AA38ZMW6_VITRO|nr:hypothetical protein PVL29_011081 [Vitis rotundifolia]
MNTGCKGHSCIIGDSGHHHAQAAAEFKKQEDTTASSPRNDHPTRTNFGRTETSRTILQARNDFRLPDPCIKSSIHTAANFGKLSETVLSRQPRIITGRFVARIAG